MWHWLPKKRLLNDPVTRTSIGLACSLHILFFLGCFVMQYLRPVTRIAVNKDALAGQQVTIIINPNIKPGLYTSAHPAPVHAAPTPASSTPKKPLVQPKTTVVATPKPVQQHTKKQPVKKAVVKKKTVSKPKKTPKKIEPKKVEKKVAASQKKIPVPADVPKKSESPSMPPPAASEATTQQSVLPADAIASAHIDGPILVARSATDAADMSVSLAVQQELLRVWRPPVGVDASVSCQIRVTLDAQGKPQKIDVIQPSGMILFDTSARAAVQQAVWPRAVWGTTIELCLQ